MSRRTVSAQQTEDTTHKKTELEHEERKYFGISCICAVKQYVNLQSKRRQAPDLDQVVAQRLVGDPNDFTFLCKMACLSRYRLVDTKPQKQRQQNQENHALTEIYCQSKVESYLADAHLGLRVRFQIIRNLETVHD